MTSSGRKPFENKSFYFDLKIYRNRDSLVKDLKKLGAKIEDFLSKDVTYVVTDRNDIKCKIESWLPGTPKSGLSTPSPIQLQGSGLEHLDSPVLTSSPANDPIKKQIMSRGLALVQRAKQKNQGTADVLEVCTQWGIKVLHVQKVISWITKFKELYSKKRSEQKNLTKEKSLELDNGAARLAAPFIKVEDVNRNFRPTFKVFKSWKDSTDSDLEAVVTQLRKKMKLDKSSSSTCYKENFDPSASRTCNIPESSYKSPKYPLTTSGQNLPSTTLSTKLRHSKKVKNSNYISSSVAKGHFVPPLQPSGTKSYMLYPSDQKYSSKRYGNHEMEEKMKVVKKRYCEICCCSYTNLDSHLLTESHRKYFNEPKNFQVIEEVTSSFPDLQYFVNQSEEKLTEPLMFQRLECCDYENVINSCTLGNDLHDCCNMWEASNEVSKDIGYMNESYMLQDFTTNISSQELERRKSDERISGSCSTLGSSNSFPFLEDSIEKLMKLNANEVHNTSLIISPIANLHQPMVIKRKIKSFSFCLPYNQNYNTLPGNEQQAIISENIKVNKEILGGNVNINKEMEGIDGSEISAVLNAEKYSDKHRDSSTNCEMNTAQFVEKATACSENIVNEGEFGKKILENITMITEPSYASPCTYNGKDISNSSKLNAVSYMKTAAVITDSLKVNYELELQDLAVLTTEQNHTLPNITSNKQIVISNSYELNVAFEKDISSLALVDRNSVCGPVFNLGISNIKTAVIDNLQPITYTGRDLNAKNEFKNKICSLSSQNVFSNLLSQEQNNLQEKCKLTYIQHDTVGNAECKVVNHVKLCPETQILVETCNSESNSMQQNIQNNQTAEPLKTMSQTNLKPFSLCEPSSISESKLINAMLVPRKCEEIQNETCCSSCISDCYSECEWKDLQFSVDSLCQSLEDEKTASDSSQNVALDLTINSVQANE